MDAAKLSALGLDKSSVKLAQMMGDDYDAAGALAKEFFGDDTPEIRVAMINAVLCYEEEEDQAEAMENLRTAQKVAGLKTGAIRAGAHETFYFFFGLFGEEE